MELLKLEGAPRETGTSAARRMRREGRVPCVLYGHGDEPVHFSVAELSLHPLIYTTETHQVEIAVDGGSFVCILKDVDFDPITDRPRHADFYILKAGEKMTITVPIHFVGKAKGQEEGGELVRVLNEVEVSCLPKDMPSYLSVDISDMEIGDSLHVDVLRGENIEILAEPTQTLVSLVPPRAEEELEPAVAEEAEEVEGIEGEEEEAEGEGEEGEETATAP